MLKTSNVFFWYVYAFLIIAGVTTYEFVMLASETTTTTDIDEKALEQVAVGTRSGMATGTVVQRSGQTYWIVTNQHVVEPVQTKNMKLWVIVKQRRFQGKLLYVSSRRPEADLALVQVDMPGVETKVHRLASSDFQVGDTIYRNGRNTGFWKGKVWKLSEFRTSYGTVVQTDHPFSANGDSGSGLFNAKGELTGVFFGSIALTENPADLDEEFPKNSSSGCTLTDLRKMLDKHLPKP